MPLIENSWEMQRIIMMMITNLGNKMFFQKKKLMDGDHLWAWSHISTYLVTFVRHNVPLYSWKQESQVFGIVWSLLMVFCQHKFFVGRNFYNFQNGTQSISRQNVKLGFHFWQIWCNIIWYERPLAWMRLMVCCVSPVRLEKKISLRCRTVLWFLWETFLGLLSFI